MDCQSSPCGLRPDTQCPATILARRSLPVRPAEPPAPHPLPPLVPLKELRSIALIPHLKQDTIEGELELSLIRCVQVGVRADKVLAADAAQGVDDAGPLDDQPASISLAEDTVPDTEPDPTIDEGADETLDVSSLPSLPLDSATRAALQGESLVGRTAGDILLRAHARALRHWTFRFFRTDRGHDLDFDDIQSAVRSAFMKAVRKFNFSEGVKLMTYAAWWFRADTGRTITDTGYTIKVPVYQVERPVAEWSPEVRAARKVVRIDAPVYKSAAGDGAESDKTHADLLYHHDRNPEEEVTERVDMSQVRSLLQDALTKLTPKERLVIQRRFLDKQERTLCEVGRGLGVSRERIRQIESNALRRLQTILGRKKAKGLITEVLNLSSRPMAPHPRRGQISSANPISAVASPRPARTTQAPSRRGPAASAAAP